MKCVWFPYEKYEFESICYFCLFRTRLKKSGKNEKNKKSDAEKQFFVGFGMARSGCRSGLATC